MRNLLKTVVTIVSFLCLFSPPPVCCDTDWFTEGLNALKAGRHPDALSAFNKAIEADPRHANAYNGRGAVWHKLGAYDRAISDYTKALEINPRYANAFNNRGVALYHKRRYTEALKDYNAAVAINPAYVNALSNRGAVYKKLGKYEQALADFNRAIAIRPSYETFNLLAWTLATCPDEKYRDGLMAVEFAEKAVSLREEVRSLGTLAAAYAEADMFEAAIRTQKQVIDRMEKAGGKTRLAEHRKRMERYRARKPLAGEPPAEEAIVEEDLAASSAAEKAEPQQAPPAGAEKTAPAAVVETTPDAPPPAALPYTVQISSFRNPQTAFREGLKLRKKGDPAFNAHAHIPSKGGDWYRLFVGLYETAGAANKAAKKLKQRKFRYARVVKMPYAVLIQAPDSENSMDAVDRDLKEKGHLPYRLPDPGNIRNELLLVGGFESETAAAREVERLRASGFPAAVVKR